MKIGKSKHLMWFGNTMKEDSRSLWRHYKKETLCSKSQEKFDGRNTQKTKKHAITRRKKGVGAPLSVI